MLKYKLNRVCGLMRQPLVLQQSLQTVSGSGDYTPVYTFPYIRELAIINKLKLYQTLGTCVAIPSSFTLSMMNMCSLDMLCGVTAIGITGCMILHTLGMMCSNTVGVVYLHKDQDKTKISYLDKWGNRRDVVVLLDDIIPFTDQPSRITDPLYLKVLQYSRKEKFKLNVKYGQVLNASKFEQIFSKVL